MSELDDLIRRALDEDAPAGDITSELFLPVESRATGVLAAREAGVLSGAEIFARTFHLVDSETRVDRLVADGSSFQRGDHLIRVDGAARSVLRAERVALNFVQRMSGIATETAAYVAEVASTRARILDTRKTSPGLRVIERQAVRDGGGHNHRFSLSDAVLAKDNHLAVLTAAGISIGDAIRDARARVAASVHFEVEVDRLDQIEEVVAAGVDTIMLDNFSIADLRTGVGIVAGRARVEASGNVSRATVAAIAATGVDVISVGSLTHSVRAVDLGLDVEVRT